MSYQKYYAEQLRTIYLENVDVLLQPETLWHYTNFASFINIIRSNELWMTHVSCLNDSKEVELAVEVTTAALNRLLARINLETYSPEHQSLFHEFVKIAKKSMLEDNSDSQWYVASFSECADDLNQWRAYASGESGIAIGFTKQTIEDLFASNQDAGASLWKTIYDKNKLSKFADEIADYTVATLIGYYDHNKQSFRTHEECVEEFMRIWGPLIDELSIIPKSESFQSEKEWRLTVHEDDVDISRMEFKARTSSISRHLRIAPSDLSWLGKKSKLPISHVMVGPSRQQDVTMASIRRLLRQQGFLEAKVLKSNSTLQST